MAHDPRRPALVAPLHIVPFQLRAGHVILAAEVNGVAARMILDSGSGASTLDAAWAAPLALPSLEKPVTGLGTGTVSLQMATTTSIRLGTLELLDQRVVLAPLAPAAAQSGMPIHGTIGRPLFDRFVVEIDYAVRELRLFEPASYEYSGDGTIVPIDMTRGVPLIQGTVIPPDGDPIQGTFVLDIGTSGFGVLFTAPAAARHAAAFERAPSIAMSSAVGMGGTLGGKVVRARRLDIGELSFDAPIACLPSGGAGFFAVTWAEGTIGAPVYERTMLVLDYSRKRAIFERGSGMDELFLYDASGIDLTTEPSDVVRVTTVASDSPASDAGVLTGDLVISVDGIAANGERLDDIRESLSIHGERRELVMIRAGRELRLGVDLRQRV